MVWSLLLFASSAFAETYTSDQHLFDLRHHDYHEIHYGDRHEWSVYGLHYNKVNYGHIFVWDTPGLSAMSLCFEIDQESQGKKYRQLVDDEYCEKLETVYEWDSPMEGQPSRCLKRDRLTGGQKFSRIVDNKRCERPHSIYQWEEKVGERVCWERDGATNGQRFRRVVDRSFCPTTLDVARAFGKKVPVYPSQLVAVPTKKPVNRAPASVEEPLEEKKYLENPEDLVEHVHHAPDRIHHR